MKILAIEKKADGLNELLVKNLLIEEAKQVWKLYKDEVLRQIYFTKDDHRAVLILECENDKQV